MAEALANLLPHWLSPLGYVAAGLIQCALLLAVPFVGAMFFVWVERKVSARIQDRLGPTRCGGKFGWLQLLADGLKLITKEDLRPKDADRVLFLLAPYISFCASFTALLALPFANGWVVQNMNVGVFFIIAVLGLEVFGVILAGYASASKWSLFGAMREAAQVVSYEVPLGLCVVVPVLIAGTMNLVDIANLQAGWFTNWLVFHDPATFITFWVYFTCATASVNRAPFDLAEAESELVAGFHTEYSGFRWLAFFMAEYGSMFIVSGLASILFLGGWNGPVPLVTWIGDLLGLSPQNSPVWAFISNLLGVFNFVFKCVAGVTFMVWVRWTLPRLRIDQVMQVCLKYCTPIAAVTFLGATLWTYVFPGGLILRTRPYGEHYAITTVQPADEATGEPGGQVATRANATTAIGLGGERLARQSVANEVGVGRPARLDLWKTSAGETPAPRGIADARVPPRGRN